jgi:transitional endoplasmic reticulum ATPase
MKRRRSRSSFPFNALCESTASDPIAPEFAIYCQKWTLRALIDLGGHSSVLHDGHCSEPGLIRSLGLNVDLELEYNHDKVLDELKKKHRETIVTSLPESTTSALMKNIAWLTEQLGLTVDEQKILFFCVLERQSVYLRQTMATLGAMTSSRIITVLSVLLEIPLPNVHKAFAQNSGLTRSGLVSIDETNCFDFCNKIDLIEGLSERLVVEQENPFNLFADNFVVAPSAELEMDRFEHMKVKLQRLTKYLESSLEKGQDGVNILIYGSPGTGKTMCARAIAKELIAELFEVAVENRQGDRINGINRLSAYRLSQRILAERKKAMIVFDEIEDINTPSRGDDFDMFGNRGNRSGQKGWFNQLLEHNKIPAIWITNNIRFLDPAHLRRFDYHLQMDIPPARVRSAMLAEFTKVLNVTKQWCDDMAANEKLSPGLMARAAKVAHSMNQAGADGTPEELLEDVIESALKVQKYTMRRNSTKSGKVGYQLEATNADCNLLQIIDGLRETEEGRLCLFGPAGTGKSAFAQFVAAELDKPVLLKRASDILGKYVGETEERMAEMFKEASGNGAVLILDEADSFLRSRENARQNWEISAVNEMLVQMESFQGIFFATTNLMDQLDSASLRRFDAKINFGFLKFDQCVMLFNNMCEQLSIDSNELAYVSLRFLDKLTPGDFTNVLRQSRLRPMRNASDLIDRLTQEMSMKKLSNGRPMGFLAQAA